MFVYGEFERLRGTAYAHHRTFLFLLGFWHRTIVERAVPPVWDMYPPPRRGEGSRPDGRGRRWSTRVDARGGRDDDDGGDDDDDASRVRRREARDARRARLARVVVRARERVAGDARGHAGDASGERTRGRAREREHRDAVDARDGGGGGRGHGER